jgi:hypothetical protein
MFLDDAPRLLRIMLRRPPVIENRLGRAAGTRRRAQCRRCLPVKPGRILIVRQRLRRVEVLGQDGLAGGPQAMQFPSQSPAGHEHAADVNHD